MTPFMVLQDMYDDEIIGLKSTSIKFKKNIKIFISMTYIATILILFYLFRDLVDFNIFTLFLLTFAFSLYYQIRSFKKNKPKECLRFSN